MLLFLDIRAHIACILGFLAKCKLLIRRLAIDFGHFMVVGKILFATLYFDNLLQATIYVWPDVPKV